MARPTLDALTPALDRTCADVLGDTVQYAADGVTFAARQAYVDYRDAVKAFEAAQVIEQEITVSGLLKSDVPARPTSAARVTLARLPGPTFQPLNVRTDEAGTGWEFEVKVVPGG
jgi:hypothetical protein